MRSIYALAFLAAAVAGCTTAPPLPPAQTVCLEVAQESPTEVDYVKRKAREFMKDQGFQLVEQQCDVAVKYDRFGAFQGETVTAHPFWISRNGYWSQEGIVHVKQGQQFVLQDYPVNLRGYSTKQSLLDDLAWQAVRPVTWLFRPGPSGGAPTSTAPAAVSTPSKTPIAEPIGQSAYTVERMDEVKACNPSPRVALVGKGAGFEAYAVTCTNGDLLQVRCEFGNCRVLK